MKVKALKSFGGLVSMRKNEVRDIKDESIVSDLLSAGYVEKPEKIETEPKKKKGNKKATK